MNDIKIETVISNKAWENPEKVLKVWTDNLDRALSISLSEIRGDVFQRTPSNIGTLRESIQGVILKRTGSEFIGVVSTPLKYGMAVETGTKPHFPPVAPLIAWAKRKFQLSEEEAKSRGYAIAKSISRKGTSTWAISITGSMGYWMFKLGLQAKKDRVLNIFAQALESIRKQLD